MTFSPSGSTRLALQVPLWMKMRAIAFQPAQAVGRRRAVCSQVQPQQSPLPLRPVVRCFAEPTTTTEAPQAQTATKTCKTCGLDSSKHAGCDGEGRQVGGVGAMPGMGWWPVKAYRPCPGLAEAGMSYTRKGQPTNEMLFGGVSLGASGAKALDQMKEQADKGIDVK